LWTISAVISSPPVQLRNAGILIGVASFDNLSKQFEQS